MGVSVSSEMMFSRAFEDVEDVPSGARVQRSVSAISGTKTISSSTISFELLHRANASVVEACDGCVFRSVHGIRSLVYE